MNLCACMFTITSDGLQTTVLLLQIVGKVQSEYDALVAEDKALEKGFKSRREFVDQEQFVDVLFKLYKRRSKKPVLGGMWQSL